RCSAAQLAILAELLLRGPQTQGEPRGRASRMNPIASLDDVQNILRGLMEQQEPLVKQLPPSPGSRAERYAQLLAPDAHPISESSHVAPVSTPQAAGGLADRVTSLES